MKSQKLILFIFFIVLVENSFPQFNPTGDKQEVKEVILNSNEVKVVLFNYGSICAPNYLGNVADFVWKGLGYMFEFGPLLTAEVVNDNGDTLRITSDSYIRTIQGDYDPTGTIKWGWLPRVGYTNPSQAQVATSNNPNSWPSIWTSWPGEYGNGVIVGLDEAYYVMDDFTNAEFPYYPFPDDTTKRGLGVKAEVRIYQFSGNMKDAVIVKYKLTNESLKPLNKVYFGFHSDPHIGGPGDYADDRVNIIRSLPGLDSIYSLAINTIYNFDLDGRGDGGRKTGYFSFKLLETPGNKDLTSFHPLVYTNSLPNVPMNDPLMWNLLSSGIDTTSPLLHNPGDNVINFGTGPFSLLPGESKYITLAIFCSDDLQDMLNDAVYIQLHFNWPTISDLLGKEGGSNDYKINLISPSSGIISGNVPIVWNYTGTNPDAKVFIECSFNKGRNWIPLAFDHPVSSSFNWNTLNFRDGVNYVLRVVAYNPLNPKEYYYDNSDQRITINNPTNAQPELELKIAFEDSIVRISPINIDWTAEDADNTNLNIKIEFSTTPQGPLTLIHSSNYPSGLGSYSWNFNNVPSGSPYYLRISASDGALDTVLVSKAFGLLRYEGYYPQSIFQHVSGTATPNLNLRVIDSLNITGNTYELTFDVLNDSTKKVNVKNLNSGLFVISDNLLIPGYSTPPFDGLKLLIEDKEVNINTQDSKFNSPILNSTFLIKYPPNYGQPQKTPDDWIIIFNNLDTLVNGKYLYPGDTTKDPLTSSNIVCPFKIIHSGTMQKATYKIFEIFGLRNSKWDFSEPIVLQPQGETGAKTSYQINFSFLSGNYPGLGDTLYIVTYKPISSNDKFQFTPTSNFLVGIKELKQNKNFILFQNYPNPFNPTTTIRFALPERAKVKITVYNILGEKRTELINKQFEAGYHEVIFDGVNYTSGIYFYKIETEKFQKVKKLILLK